MNTQGIGLGLMISESIVKFFDGMIGVRSKYGKGTKFAFCFILDKVQREKELNFTERMNEVMQDAVLLTEDCQVPFDSQKIGS